MPSFPLKRLPASLLDPGFSRLPPVADRVRPPAPFSPTSTRSAGIEFSPAGHPHPGLAGTCIRVIAAAVVIPTRIELIGAEIAIKWADGVETFVATPALRAASPSAAARGEPDIFGRVHGGEGFRDFSGVTVVGWEIVGNYAVRFEFSDGHNTGLYTYDLLRRLGDAPTSS